MATYKEIFGTNIEVLASDPANPVQGQVWYNSTDNVVKGSLGPLVGTWATGGDLNTGRQEGATAASSNTAGIFFAGSTGVPTLSVLTESYNGTSWTEVNDLGTARRLLASAGTETAGLAFGGFGPGNISATESWNGTSWSPVSSLNTARYGISGGGLQTSALAFGGNTNPPFVQYTNVESWNGSAWTETTDFSSIKNSRAGVGDSNTAMLAVGGSQSPNAITELFNGSTWTEVGDLNTGRGGAAGAGTSTAGLIFSGSVPPYTGATESYNGTTWTEVNDRSVATGGMGSGAHGSQTNALAAGGYTTRVDTEEWSEFGGTITFTDS